MLTRTILMTAIAIGSAVRHFVRCLLATHMGSGVAIEPHRRVRYAVFLVVRGTDAFACHSVRVLPVCAIQDCRLQGCSPRMASLQFQMQGSAISSFTAEPYGVSRRDGVFIWVRRVDYPHRTACPACSARRKCLEVSARSTVRHFGGF